MLRRLALGLLATAVACGSSGGSAGTGPRRSEPTTSNRLTPGLRLSSPAFTDGSAIPRQYTCDGANQSPPLAWTGVPAGTASLALRVQDIDTSQLFVHWLVYDIPTSTSSIAAGDVPSAARQAANSFGKASYGGPCPPSGSKHRYVFTLLSMATELTVSDQVSPAELWSTLERSAVNGRAQLTGTYQRGG